MKDPFLSEDVKETSADDSALSKFEQTQSNLAAQQIANFADPLPEPDVDENLGLTMRTEAITALDDDSLHKPVRFKYLYVLIFALVSLNDGIVLGYKGSLGAIFAVKKVPSEIRSLMSIITVTYVLRMFFAPIADKYFSAWMGKRKTYIVPCKLFAFAVYTVFSNFIEDWVARDRVPTIATYFFLVNTVMILENNALQGFRLDFFGRKDAGAAGAAHTLSNLLGMAIGLQVFTSLNSEYVCTTYLGLKDKVLSHTDMFRLIGVLNLFSCALVVCIQEKENFRPAIMTDLGLIRVIKAIYRTSTLWKAVLWNFFGPTLVLAMKVTVGQYYFDKHLRREDYILCLAAVMIPTGIIANLIWIRLTKRGKLMIKLWLAILNGVVVECLHVFNYTYFDAKTNYRRTLICICFILALDCCANWLMIQSSFFASAAPKKYAVTFLATIYSMFSAFRAVPITVVNALVDYVPMQAVFITFLLGQLTYNICTYKMVRDIDKKDPKEVGQEFADQIEAGVF